MGLKKQPVANYNTGGRSLGILMLQMDIWGKEPLHIAVEELTDHPLSGDMGKYGKEI